MQHKLFMGFMMFFAWSSCSAADIEASELPVAPHGARVDRTGTSSVVCKSLVSLLNRKLQDVVFRITFHEWVKDNRIQQRRLDRQLTDIRIDIETVLKPVTQTSSVFPLGPTILAVRVVQSQEEQPIVNIEPRNYTYFISPSTLE